MPESNSVQFNVRLPTETKQRITDYGDEHNLRPGQATTELVDKGLGRPSDPACWNWDVPEAPLDNDPIVYLRLWQAGHCGFCGKFMVDNNGYYLDHDHDTNLVRGFLCTSCNTEEGFSKSKGTDKFNKYRQRPPAAMLGLEVKYSTTYARDPLVHLRIPQEAKEKLEQMAKDERRSQANMGVVIFMAGLEALASDG